MQPGAADGGWLRIRLSDALALPEAGQRLTLSAAEADHDAPLTVVVVGARDDPEPGWVQIEVAAGA
jgi:hypothetical protein